jgi:hypothetical protein
LQRYNVAEKWFPRQFYAHRRVYSWSAHEFSVLRAASSVFLLLSSAAVHSLNEVSIIAYLLLLLLLYTTIMENKFIPDAIEIISRAIQADNDGEYEKALSLYRDALGRFTIGLKYEKNESRKKLVLERVEGYMKRAEELRDYIQKQGELDAKGGGGGSATKSKDDGEEPDDAEKTKLRGALQGAIITEKPNVRWDDVAGLEAAKDSLKEVRNPGHLVDASVI